MRARANLETEWSENLDGFSSLSNGAKANNSDDKRKSEKPLTLLWEMIEIPILLILIGVSSAIISFSTSYVVMIGNGFRWSLMGASSDYNSWIFYCIWCQIMAFIACISTQLICRESAGGGLPEMKTILSGVVKPVLLSKRLIVAKITGLSFSLLAGLSVGKEGPFVHASAAMADQLMRLPIFRHLRTQDSKRLEMMACACASGVSGSFGTAFGGVLFSIEFTASAYSVRTLPKAFLTSAVAMLVFFFLGASDQLSLFNSNKNVSQWMPYAHEMVAFVLIGIICALLGVLFVSIVEIITGFRNSFLDKSKYSQETIDRRKIFMVSVVTLIVSLLMYYEMAAIPEIPRLLIDYMFDQENLQPLLPKLLIYFPYKFLITALSVTLPLPVGLFTPVFMTGSVLGRIIGESICHWPLFVNFTNFSPSDYSILAAAGFSTGVTRAISTAVIVYELSGEPHLRLPLSVVILTAYFVGNRFSKNIYDALIDKNGTPYMQEIPKSMLTIPVANIMMPIDESHVLALNSTYKDALLLIRATSPAASHESVEPLPESILESPARFSEVNSEEENMELLHRSDCSDSSPSPSRGAYNSQYGSISSSMAKSKGVHHYVINMTSPPRVPLPAKKVHTVYCTVIPVVQNKKSMVIVGAVLREDVKSALDKLIKFSRVVDAAPVELGLRDEEEATIRGDSEAALTIRGISLAPLQSNRKSSRKAFSTAGGAAVDNKVPSNFASSVGVNESYSPHSPTPTIASLERSLLRENLRESRTPSQLPYRLIGVEDFPADRTANGDFSSADEALYDLLNETIQFVLFTNGGRSIAPVMSAASDGRRSLKRTKSWRALPMAIPIDPSPYQIVDSMYLCKVDLLFRMLSLNQAYVTNSGRLVGLVTRASLRLYLDDKVKRPIHKCAQLFAAIYHSCCCKSKSEPSRENISATFSEEILGAVKV